MPSKAQRYAARRRAFGRPAGTLLAIGLFALAGLGPAGTGAAQPIVDPAAGLAAEDVVIDIGRLDAESARALAQQLPEWEEPINAGTEQLRLPAERLAALEAAGYDFETVDGLAQAPTLAPWPACYHRLDEVYDWLAEMEEAHAELIDVIDIGDSWCKLQGGCSTPGGDSLSGRDLLVAKVTSEGALSPKEGRFWIDGGIHAREIPTVELMMDTIRRMVEGYGQDPQISYLLDHRELYVGIASNPDGRLLVEMGAAPPYETAPWMWRKNANDSAEADCGWPPTGSGQYGVDLNRNQDFKWDEEGHSTNPCSQTYRGAAPASEPEIQAYEDYLRTLFEDQRGPEDSDAAGLETTGMMINFHNATWPGTTLVPWGWTTERSANDEGLWAIGERYSLHNGYRTQYSLYPVSGNTRDWGYGELGIPAYVIELQGRDFVSPCIELPVVLRQNREAIEMSLALSDLPYQRIRGPEVARASVEPARVRAGQRVRVRARVSDLRAGADALAEARLSIGQSGGLTVGQLPGPGLPPEAGLPMQAEDGAFDEVSEWVTLSLDTSELQPGSYYLVLRGRDAAAREDGQSGFWGNPRAVGLEILSSSSVSRHALD